MSICIVIPTYNRFPELKQTLLGLSQQTVTPDRVVVIDDGSSSGDLKQISDFCHTLALPLTFFQNAPKHGPAAARNAGILASKEERILFINDDTRPADSTFLEQHLDFAASHPESMLLGKLAWAPETPNPLLFGKWTRRLGFDVGYGGLKKGDILGFQKFCTANVLVPRKFLQKCLFDEAFPFAAYEDIELGFRLSRQGRTLMYNPDPCVYHVHKYTPEMVIDRQRKAGYALAYFLKSHPELRDIYRPRISSFQAFWIRQWVSSPLGTLGSEDFQLFLRQIDAKYSAFWENFQR